ncbi:hypothetical protein TUM15795_06430 [Neisseria gonorrhoeae]|nr:hypothetical protein TUM15795_06430 [Neisseria gonorrhoeae]
MIAVVEEVTTPREWEYKTNPPAHARGFVTLFGFAFKILVITTESVRINNQPSNAKQIFRRINNNLIA